MRVEGHVSTMDACMYYMPLAYRKDPSRGRQSACVSQAHGPSRADDGGGGDGGGDGGGVET